MAAAAVDDSCRRPGAVPFKWEVCPGTPKHARSSSAGPPPPYSAAANGNAKAAVTPKLTPPPAMSPSPYHSPRVSSYYAARSASVSPSRRRPHHRPTAFIDVAPRAAPVAYAFRGDEDDDQAAAAYRCFPLPVFRRKERDGKNHRRSGISSFRSEGAPALRRSASSSSSSSCLSLSSRSSSKVAEPREVEAAGCWFY